MARQKPIWKSIDKYLLGMYMLLIFCGIITILSSSNKGTTIDLLDFSSVYGNQLIWVFISLISASFVLMLESQFIKNTAYIFYGFILLLLIGVLFMEPIKGARSWFQIGGMSIQPSELAKLSCSLVLAKYLSGVNVKIQDFNTKIRVFVLLGLPCFFIILQPDPGTMLVFIAFIFVVYREGLSGNILLFGLYAGIVMVIAIFLKASESDSVIMDYSVSGNYVFSFVLILLGGLVFTIIKLFVLPRYRWVRYKAVIISLLIGIGINVGINFIYDDVFEDRHRTRFKVMFGIKEDRLGDGYNMWQSLSAIGSGELTGKGYMKGTLSNDKYNHVPEQSTDFIFCSLAEEWGFLGSLVFIILYLATLIRIIIISERQRSKFTRIFGYCVASILFFHFMINIGMVIGLAPVIGIPLPFFSKGGSSMLTFTVLIFILLRLDAERKDVLR